MARLHNRANGRQEAIREARKKKKQAETQSEEFRGSTGKERKI